MLSRRRFGQHILQGAGALGLRSVVASAVRQASRLGLGAAGVGGLTETLAQASAAMADNVEHARVLVVGTGYGGAVAALRMAQRGIPVTMLEMGRFWNTPGADGKVFCSLLAPDARAMWRKTSTQAVVSNFLGLSTSFNVPFSAGVLDVLNHPGMNVYCGRGVGGGSLVNLAMTITPLREVLSSIMPAGVDLNALYQRHYPLARSMLGVNDIRPAYFESSAYHRYARVARDLLGRAGISTYLLPSAYSYAYMELEEAAKVPKSALNYEASFGNNYGKGSLDKNYLADALATGLVTLHTLHGVKRIETTVDGRYLLTIQLYDANGQITGTKQMSCEHLFLAGGSMGTTELLVRARDTGALPRLNAHVGTHWSSNGDIFVARQNTLWNPTGTKQSMVPASGFNTRDHLGQPVFSMNLPLPAAGLETWANMNIVMTRTPDLGSFRYDPATDAVILDWSGRAAKPVVSTRAVFDRVNLVNGTSYRTDLFGGKTVADGSTYHPVGGCPLGLATDLFGRVVGYDKLYVIDGAMLPDGLVANPALTIAAMAERNMEALLSTSLTA